VGRGSKLSLVTRLISLSCALRTGELITLLCISSVIFRLLLICHVGSDVVVSGGGEVVLPAGAVCAQALSYRAALPRHYICTRKPDCL